MTDTVTAADVLAFWRAAGPPKWFAKDAGFDAAIRDRFLGAYEAAAAGRLAAWEETPEGALALCIVLDQFPRNMFRGDARAFASDAHALAIAKDAIARGHDMQLDHPKRGFFYLPLMHSEVLADQEHSVGRQLIGGTGADSLMHARAHRLVIRRFGRFPYRNAVLGRETTPLEQAFLDAGGYGAAMAEAAA